MLIYLWTNVKGSDGAGRKKKFGAQNRYSCLASFSSFFLSKNVGQRQSNVNPTSIQRNVCGRNGNYQVSSLRDKNNQKWRPIHETNTKKLLVI